MATLTPTRITAGLSNGVYAGTTYSSTYAAATATTGDKARVADPSRGFFAVKNGGGSTIYAKVVCQRVNGQGELENHMVRVAHLGYVDALDTLMVVSTLEAAFKAHGIKVAASGCEAAQDVLAPCLKG